MPSKKLDDKKIIAAYEERNPDKESIEEFCVKMEMSKQSLYAVLRRNDVTPASQRVTAGSTRAMIEEILQGVNDIKAALGIAEAMTPAAPNGHRLDTTTGQPTDQKPRVVRRRRRVPTPV